MVRRRYDLPHPNHWLVEYMRIRRAPLHACRSEDGYRLMTVHNVSKSLLLGWLESEVPKIPHLLGRQRRAWGMEPLRTPRPLLPRLAEL